MNRILYLNGTQKNTPEGRSVKGREQWSENIWSCGQGPSTRGDTGKRSTTAGMWRAFNARLENSDQIWQ